MSRKTLLHIDDNSDDLFLFRRACSQAGVSFHLESNDDGKEAQDYLQSLGQYSDSSKFPPPDFVLLDLKMPPPDGFAMLAWIRERTEFNHLMVCIFTSSFQYEDIQKAYAGGANSFLTKPPAYNNLVAIATALNQSIATTPPDVGPLKQLPEFRQ